MRRGTTAEECHFPIVKMTEINFIRCGPPHGTKLFSLFWHSCLHFVIAVRLLSCSEYINETRHGDNKYDRNPALIGRLVGMTLCFCCQNSTVRILLNIKRNFGNAKMPIYSQNNYAHFNAQVTLSLKILFLAFLFSFLDSISAE